MLTGVAYSSLQSQVVLHFAQELGRRRGRVVRCSGVWSSRCGSGDSAGDALVARPMSAATDSHESVSARESPAPRFRGVGLFRAGSSFRVSAGSKCRTTCDGCQREWCIRHSCHRLSCISRRNWAGEGRGRSVRRDAARSLRFGELGRGCPGRSADERGNRFSRVSECARQ